EYLIAENLWNTNRDALLLQADFGHLKNHSKVMADLKQRLEAAYESTNQSILLGENKFMRFQEQGKFSVTTPKVDKEVTEKLVDWFPNTQIIPLSEVLATVNRLTGYLDELVHIQPKYIKNRPQNALFYAGIMAYGCNVGIQTMTKVATPMSEVELENTVNAYFSLANVDKANDLIVAFTEKLELPQIYKRHKDSLHTSSDGQKFAVKGNSIHSTYCYKYFKKGRGATAYSFTDERHLLWHSTVIDSFEREATYVIDGMLHNETIQSNIHSTDTHGYTEAVFALMNLLGIEFAPRIAKLYKQQLYAFAKNIEYTQKGYKILPDGYINTELIEENWDNILRLLTSIKLKECTASQIFKRLNSYSRQHPVYKALKEYGKIVKTIFLLKYIDDVELRQAIRKQLNKIENANKFSDAIRFANNGESIFPTRQEQLVAESCTRLIKNTIICWNYLYLSHQIKQAKSQERKRKIVEAIKAGSVMAWQHIYFHGLYDFSDEKLAYSFDLLASQNHTLNLEQILG
ncbi:MAG: transposase, partial [Bacteroidota bacterium]